MTGEWIRDRQQTGIARVSIDETKVSARVAPLGTILTFPLEWEWSTYGKEQLISLEMVQGTSELLWADGKQLALSLPVYSLNGAWPNNLKYPLGLNQVEQIETLRNAGDAKFDIRITFMMAIIARGNLHRQDMGAGISAITEFMTGIRAIQTDLFVNIPKSQYEDNLLPHLGINGLASLTITFPPGINQIFSAALYELQRAEKTLRTASTEEQFESVVLQCRNSIDSLLNQFHFELPTRANGNPDASFRTRVDALGEQYLKDVLSESQLKSVCGILHVLWEPYSGAAKPGPAHHSRAYATFALHQAASVVKLISETLSAKQRS